MITIDCEVGSFTFTEHVNIIGGVESVGYDSGTHKSHFYSLLEDQQRLKRLKSNKKIHFVNSLESFNSLDITLSSDHCIIADELNFDPNGLDKLFRKVRAGNAFLIAIGRMYIKQFEYSVDAIWKLERDMNKFNISRVFENVIRHNLIVKTVACEDSASIAAIYSELLDCDVFSVNSRSAFLSYCKKDNIFIIADKPKFGQELLNLIYMSHIKNKPTKTIILYLIDGFEEIICELANLDSSTLLSENFFDKEYYYEELAKQEPLWNKKKVAASIFALHSKYNFNDSRIVRNLIDFYKGNGVLDFDNCYCINIDSNLHLVYNNYDNDKSIIMDSLKKSILNTGSESHIF